MCSWLVLKKVLFFGNEQIEQIVLQALVLSEATELGIEHLFQIADIRRSQVEWKRLLILFARFFLEELCHAVQTFSQWILKKYQKQF